MKTSVSLFAAALAVSAAFSLTLGDAEARGGRGGGHGRGGHDSGSVLIGGGAGQHMGGNHGGSHNNHGGNGGNHSGGMRMGNPGVQALTRGGGRITPDVPRPQRHHHYAHYRGQRGDCIYSGAHVYPGVGGYWVQPRTHCGETYPGNGAMGPSPNLFR